MQKIRRATKKHRKLLTVIVALLTVGLVGSFAVWNTDNYNPGDSSDKSITEQITMFEEYIAENEPAKGDEVDYSTAESMAGTYMTLNSLYREAYSEVIAEDEEAATEYFMDSVNAADKAASYYQIQLDQAPETLNDNARAQILANKAMATALAQKPDDAQALYDEALALAPENSNIINDYTDFLYSTQGIEVALDFFEKTLSKKEPAEGEEIDYNTAAAMASSYMQLWSLSYNAYLEVVTDDPESGLVYNSKAIEAANKAANYYQIQIDEAPDTLNDQERSQILGNMAAAKYYSNMINEAQELYDEALALAPENFELAIKYFEFTYKNQGLETAQAYADSYMALVGEESEYYELMQQAITYYQMVDEINNTEEDVAESDANDEADGSADEGSEDEVDN